MVLIEGPPEKVNGENIPDPDATMVALARVSCNILYIINWQKVIIIVRFEGALDNRFLGQST